MFLCRLVFSLWKVRRQRADYPGSAANNQLINLTTMIRGRGATEEH